MKGLQLARLNLTLIFIILTEMSKILTCDKKLWKNEASVLKYGGDMENGFRSAQLWTKKGIKWTVFIRVAAELDLSQVWGRK